MSHNKYYVLAKKMRMVDSFYFLYDKGWETFVCIEGGTAYGNIELS